LPLSPWLSLRYGDYARLQWVGIHQERIFWDALFIKLGGTKASCLSDPERNYDNPPWNPVDGANALEFLRSILSYGLRLYVRYTPQQFPGYVPPWSLIMSDNFPPWDTVQTFGVGDGETRYRDLSASVDYTNIFTHVRVIGRDADGAPIIELVPVPQTTVLQGFWGFTGPQKVHVVIQPDLKTIGDVQRVAQQEIQRAKRPILQAELVTDDPTALQLSAHERVNLLAPRHMANDYDPAPVNYHYLVREVAIRHGERYCETSLKIDALWTRQDLPHE
jgi:hypothetical protein